MSNTLQVNTIINSFEQKCKGYLSKLLEVSKKLKKRELAKLSSFENFGVPSVADLSEEDTNLIQIYGSDVYSFSLELESFQISKNFLLRHSLSPLTRTKMVDWMIGIFASYNSEPGTFFLCVNILDTYIQNCRSIIYEDDIHLIGMACIFLASKMEDINPLHMVHIKTKIGKDKFSARTILKQEREIFKTLDYCLISVHTYDFIRTYLYDFCVNNQDKINELGLKDHIKSLENVCTYLAKLLTLNEEFSKYQHSLKAIGCIITGFDIHCSNSPNMTDEREKFIRQWISFLLDKCEYSHRIIGEVYNKIVKFYQDNDKISIIAPNLNSKHKFCFC